MIVRYIGQIQRVNSFGVFVPGKEYDVSAEVGNHLLSAPNMFVEVGAAMSMAKTASRQVLEVSDEDSKSKYQELTVKELQPILLERGVNVRRAARKNELIRLLEDDDKRRKTNGDDDNGDTETESVRDSED